MDQTRKKNLTNPTTWMRLVYIILFVIAFYVAMFVLVAVVVVQFLFKLITGESNEHLRGLGRSLGTYTYEIIAFVTFHTDEMPFPFASWPEGAPAREPAKAKAAAKPERARRSRKPKAPAKPAASAE